MRGDDRTWLEWYPIGLARATTAPAPRWSAGSSPRANREQEPRHDGRDDDGYHDHVLAPADESAHPLDPIAQAVADRVARADRHGDVDRGAQQVGDEKAHRTQAGASGERPGH